MKLQISRPKASGFTIIELIVVVAVAALLLTVAAPSMREFIVKQRLKSVNAELVSDLQWVRSEAISRNLLLRVQFQETAAMTCYVAYIQAAGPLCDCTRPPGTNVCTGAYVELRTVQIPTSSDVQVKRTVGVGAIGFMPDGMMNVVAPYVLETSRVSLGSGKLQVTFNGTGRPGVCSPDASVVGVASCL